MVTPTAKGLIPEALKRIGLNLSEFLEHWSRGLLIVQWRDFSIAELVQGWNLEELARESCLTLEELEAIAKGAKPSDTALIRLGGLLTKPVPNQDPLSTEDLRQIRTKTFPPAQPKVGNGNGN
ncbi:MULTISPECIES: hypothetical protein [Trichocoleus]|uniref:Uncharacterized protein n=1 Tax=Trichocoleus desertorum GB2-A4 TaxID=2933944 RepID=A0ABV0JCY7_9CYAN|nr:hypothetical protein [Trichocoleus sp. FACHB-46]MBD1864273.1 hypothetical protein [Trichocoleus sp. FACHB-46]